MMIVKKLFFICLILLRSLVFSQNITSKQFSSKEGLPDLYIYSSFQDDDGFLWSATTKGLVKFDGQIFKHYLLKNQTEDFIYSGATDSNGLNWFGTFGGKIYSYNKRKDSLFLYKDSINGSIDRVIVSADKRSIYFVSKGNGIYILRENNLSQIQHVQIYQINGVVEFEKGILILATPDGLFKVNVNTTEVKKIKGIDYDITRIQKIKNSDRKLLLSTSENGLFEAQFNQNLDELVFIDLPELKFLKEQGISCFYLDEVGNSLMIATRRENFYFFNTINKKIDVIRSSEFQATANTIILDRDNNIWVSTAGKGLFRFFKEEYSFVPINGRPVYAITKDNNGQTYFGTDKGIFITDNHYTIINSIEKAGNFILEKITALYFDGVNLWIGTEDNGLFLMNTSTKMPVQLEFSKIPNIAINAISGNKKTNTVYVSTNLDGVFIYQELKQKHHFSVHNSLLHNNVYFAFESHDKKIYYATHNTAFNFSREDQVYEIDIKSNGLISDFNTFVENAQGQLAIGTNGDGVYFLNDTAITSPKWNQNLESKFCNSLIYDKQDNLWIALRYGLYKYYSAANVLKKIELAEDNQRMFNANAVSIDSEGELLFGTTKDVICFKSKNNESELPQSYILKIKMFDSIIPYLDSQSYKNGKYDLSFEYSALCLKNSENVYFRYILEGRDNKWSEPTKSRIAEFSNLTEGKYTFRVMAYNGDGFSSKQSSSYTFTINQPVWKSTWFWLVIFVVLSVIVFFIIRIRTSALIQANEKLEKIVDEKTKQIREEKETIEENKKVIEKQHADITSSITYAKRIQEAILPDKKVLRNNSESIFVYYKPRDIVSGDFYWIAEKEKDVLFGVFDCTGHGVPGAFMSMIGTTLLNKIVFDKNETSPEKIIFEMDIEVSKSLRQENSEVNDGMEGAICKVDFEKGNVYYTGAKRPLYLFRNNLGAYTLEEFKADKFPIGGYADIKNKKFTLNKITVGKGDILYMFSDGIIDQFNTTATKRIGSKQLKQLLLSIAHLPLNEQSFQLNSFIETWQGQTHQTDDILIFGIRI